MIALLAHLAATGAVAALAMPSDAHRFSRGQSRYIEACGGCHGIAGVSSGRDVPRLRDQAGYLLCTDEARSYVLRLPNIAFSAMSPGDMAEAMNFVTFGLGGGSAPAGARPFTAVEVLKARTRPLKSVSLEALRRSVRARAAKACGVDVPS